MKIKLDKGVRFGKLVVLNESEKKRLPSGQANRVFTCQCDCGNIKDVRLAHLVRNKIQSCGCINKTRNGNGNTLLIKVWRQMISRCSEREKSDINKRNYFDKGIRVSDEFMNWDFFYDWSIKNGYAKGLTLDRKDNKKGYSASNCRWVTQQINNNNRSDTVLVNYNGTIEPIKIIIRRNGLIDHYNTILGRIKRGWDPVLAIDTAIRKGKYRVKRDNWEI